MEREREKERKRERKRETGSKRETVLFPGKIEMSEKRNAPAIAGYIATRRDSPSRGFASPDMQKKFFTYCRVPAGDSCRKWLIMREMTRLVDKKKIKLTHMSLLDPQYEGQRDQQLL